MSSYQLDKRRMNRYAGRRGKTAQVKKYMGASDNMLSREMCTDDYIRYLYERTGNDPALLERVIYAFGLLEAIRRIRVGKNNIQKRHFWFKYHSPRNNRDVTILLDVLFEEIQYNITVKCLIKIFISANCRFNRIWICY